ncbi:variable surface lipoprotein [Mycoplasmopsis agalactiae]|uniref:P40, predicted lipoprotein n=13 Tax=Mycoplasmatota TaxID=544448 RepID=F5HEF4_MYCAP|nr:variable surface lipoprotein [Mycoplasmopsis agalactiae]MCE6057021.1 variable surface lipoprotein [Mycoplasmopsis agalactiae]MCE6078809.1 variable surface lipoprotein [Mycoplasmopsis agalactiae]MCE6095191.1 variable surface lipoprotein [Mycoplasmopsis agalactiae]MCE6114446.1 variable surface lipoprotein [Mycoplasmopsis agalactiae]NLS34282.1 variable surface lipoprotein [Mycoplasmopsis agalactiae]
MKTNRKILFGLLTASSFTAVPLLAAKCDDKNENSQKNPQDNGDKVEKQALGEVVKNTNLGEIVLPKDKEIPEASSILESLVKTNATVDTSELEVSNILKNGATVSAKKESKKYSGSINVTFTIKKSDDVVAKKDLSKVNKDNFKFLTNFVFGSDLLEALKTDLELPNLKLDDFQFTVDKLATADKEGKLVIEAKPTSKLITGTVILDIPRLVVKPTEENHNIADAKKLLDETLKNLSILESKMDSNIKNIEKWEANTSDGGVFTEEAKKIKDTSSQVKAKFKEAKTKVEMLIKDKTKLSDEEIKSANKIINDFIAYYFTEVKSKDTGKIIYDGENTMRDIKKIAKLKNGNQEKDSLIEF